MYKEQYNTYVLMQCIRNGTSSIRISAKAKLVVEWRFCDLLNIVSIFNAFPVSSSKYWTLLYSERNGSHMGPFNIRRQSAVGPT